MILQKKTLIWLLLIVTASIFVACSNAPEKENTTTEETEILDLSNMPSMMGDSVHTLVSDSGRLTYRMQAPKLAIYDKVEKPYWDFPEGIHMTTYNKDMGIDGDIKSKFAIYDVQSELWELRTEVEAINPDGNKVETELLYWDRKNKRIYTDKFVKITEDGLITTGYGFETDESFNEWTLKEFSSDFIMEE